jgi:hypothetical protein
MRQRPSTGVTDHTRTTHRRGVLATLAAVAALASCSLAWAQPAPLTIERDGGRLRLSATQFHFLSGAPLERLHDGRSVVYVLSVSLQVHRGEASGAGPVRQVAFSYDLWEERFAVTLLDDPKVSASHLTAAEAEAWCVGLMELPARAAPTDKSFVVKLECSAREEGTQPADAPSATTFTGLIDLLSRKARAAPPHWEAASLPLRLADIKDKAQK